MKTDRLLRLADKLDETGPYEGVKLTEKMKFNLETWFHCGTVACAVGHAAVDPWFRRRGLTLVGESSDKRPACRGQRRLDTSWAPAVFFGISDDDVEHLFYAESYRSNNPHPKTVAKRIREFVAAE